MENTFEKNAMDFGEGNEEFEMNEEAEKLINSINRQKAKFKKKAVAEMLSVMNDICKKNKIQYFAVGKLLSFWSEGMDNYPEDNSYQLRMIRKDYDIFTEYLKNHRGDYDVKVQAVYGSDDVIRCNTFAIKKRFKMEEKNVSFNSNIVFNIIPLDEIPVDEDEYEAFRHEVRKITRIYRGTSKDFMALYGEECKGIFAKIKRKILSQREFKGEFFTNCRKEAREIITRYNGRNTGRYARLEMLLGRTEYKEDIFPIQTEKFSKNSSIMVPANVKAFSLKDIYHYVSHSKSVQSRALKEFHEFCEKNDITYFAIGSLLIECVKDEPIEEDTVKNWKVGLLREDYEKAVSLLSNPEKRGNLVLKRGQEMYPLIPRKEVGFVCREDDNPDILGKNYHVLMEVLDYIPSRIERFGDVKVQLDTMRKLREEVIKEEKGLTRPKSTKSVEQIQKEIHDYAMKCGDKESGKVAFLASGYPQTIAVSEILPIQKKDYRGFTINVPANEFLWYQKGDKKFTDTIVKEKTKLLDTFHKMCMEEGIEYFAIAKLLIGAVVYHDVIPNSGHENIYVGLVRKEYEKLLSYVRENGSKWNLVVNEFYDKKQKYPMINKNISFAGKENSREKLFITPFDKLPESVYLRRKFRRDIKMMNDRYANMINYIYGKDYDTQDLMYEERKKKCAEMDALGMAAEIEAFAQRFNDDEYASSYERIAFNFSKIIDEDDLYPICTEKYRDIEICRPRDYSVWQPIQDENLLFQVKCIQEQDKRIIKELDRVCQKLGIGYFICGGTMLGYMRHKGFIPWDDDVDVAMLREDYDRFLAEAGKELGKEYFLQTRETDPNCPYLFTKLRLHDTEYITEYNEKRDFHKGLCLDIFPFDYIPNDAKKRQAFVEKVIALSKEHGRVADGQLPEDTYPFPPRNEEDAADIAEEKALIDSFWATSLKETQERYIKKATKYNSRAAELGLTTVASFIPSYTYIDIADLLPYQRGVFEGIEVSVPKRPDVFLEMQYGDYMQMPPLHNRVAHRLIRWSDGVNGADNTKKKKYEKE